ncbi:MAG: tRNA preQ1(34) S-adenosylmethionine ribosyltransferase-isomerase QueA [Clostridia bacterium]|jgi:S-adenosylmethionine:tRNA ribosyltransferase-isomerase
MKVSDFYYDLPKELIAQEPIPNRQMSRMLVLKRDSGNVEHKHFLDLLSCLKREDCLVLNDTRVIPARLIGKRGDTGGKIEFVLLKKRDADKWEVILKPGRRAKPGSIFVFGDDSPNLDLEDGSPNSGNEVLKAEILEILDDGIRLVQFKYEGIFEEILDRIGTMPLPPYITKKLNDKERYQTVYSKYKGSAAAPTAGLHFTNELLRQIKNKGVNIAYLTLHVGLGTFRPVKVDDVAGHKMHSEYFTISKETCDLINSTRKNSGRIIAVGTTSCRVLESVADENGTVKPFEGNTDIFIYPGYKFKAIDALITNFHLPESTLIMLVSAFAGRENVLNAYKKAIDERYRFFSFGDSMFIE